MAMIEPQLFTSADCIIRNLIKLAWKKYVTEASFLATLKHFLPSKVENDMSNEGTKIKPSLPIFGKVDWDSDGQNSSSDS